MLTQHHNPSHVNDAVAFERIERYLRDLGADTRSHSHGRSLLDHLMGTAAIVKAWAQPEALQLAALVHSIYGTDVYGQACLSPASDRPLLRDLVGSEAERLAYLFGSLDRRLFWETLRCRGATDDLHLPSMQADELETLTQKEIFGLIILYTANEAEQARSAGGGPGRWLGTVSRMAENLLPEFGIVPPLFRAKTPIVAAGEEPLLVEAYSIALETLRTDAVGATNLLAKVAQTAPLLAEPHVWLSYVAHAVANPKLARSHASKALRLSSLWGTAWDKRLSVEQWRALAQLILEAQPVPISRVRRPFAVKATTEATFSSMRSAATASLSEESRGRERFGRYMESYVSETDGLAALYPELPAKPWYDPKDFEIVATLEEAYDSIRAEVSLINAEMFHRESERKIARTGSWDVFVLYERGKKRTENLAVVPRTAEILESFRTIKTYSGLAYFSRMRPQTHIEAHTGPTNMRVRCHLPLVVPEGDCAIRVGDETRRWSGGRCIVFDDRFRHEAWNHTAEERLVLIVDLWHPALTPIEVRLLTAFQSRILAQADNLHRYWAGNDRARLDAGAAAWG